MAFTACFWSTMHADIDDGDHRVSAVVTAIPAAGAAARAHTSCAVSICQHCTATRAAEGG